MKSVTRTVLDDTLTSVTSYSSGPLFVGDLYELAMDVNMTGAVGAGGYGFSVYRIAADGSLYPVGSCNFQFGGTGISSISIGAGLQTNNVPGVAFGDQIQIDLLNASGVTLTGRISVLGK